jgi:hypothetical protein
MKITAFTVLISIFAIMSLASLLRQFGHNKLGIRSTFIWALMWLSIAVFSIFPDVLDDLMEAAGMGNRLFFVLVAAVLALLALVFNLTSRVDRLARDLGLALRELAIATHRIELLSAAQRKDEQRKTNPIDEKRSSPADPAHNSAGNDTIAVLEHPLDHSR